MTEPVSDQAAPKPVLSTLRYHHGLRALLKGSVPAQAGPRGAGRVIPRGGDWERTGGSVLPITGRCTALCSQEAGALIKGPGYLWESSQMLLMAITLNKTGNETGLAHSGAQWGGLSSQPDPPGFAGLEGTVNVRRLKVLFIFENS